MSIFTNIHKLANRIIPRQKIKWRKAGDTTISEYGIAVSQYGEWMDIYAHAMPGIISSFGGKNINERDYKDMGLDFSKNYYTVYCDDIGARTVCEQHGADQFMINGKVFNIIQTEDWEEFGYNGWKRCYCVQVIDGESGSGGSSI
jgi:hypothetical protein